MADARVRWTPGETAKKNCKDRYEEEENEGLGYEVAACDPDHEGPWEGEWEPCELLSHSGGYWKLKILSDGMVCKRVDEKFIRLAMNETRKQRKQKRKYSSATPCLGTGKLAKRQKPKPKPGWVLKVVNFRDNKKTMGYHEMEQDGSFSLRLGVVTAASKDDLMKEREPMALHFQGEEIFVHPLIWEWQLADWRLAISRNDKKKCFDAATMPSTEKSEGYDGEEEEPGPTSSNMRRKKVAAKAFKHKIPVVPPSKSSVGNGSPNAVATEKVPNLQKKAPAATTTKKLHRQHQRQPQPTAKAPDALSLFPTKALYEVAACDASHEGEWLGEWETCQLISRTKRAGCTVKLLSDGMVCKNILHRFVRLAAVPKKMEDGCATSMLTNKNVGFQHTFSESSSGEETASDEEVVSNFIEASEDMKDFYSPPNPAVVSNLQQQSLSGDSVPSSSSTSPPGSATPSAVVVEYGKGELGLTITESEDKKGAIIMHL